MIINANNIEKKHFKKILIYVNVTDGQTNTSKV